MNPTAHEQRNQVRWWRDLDDWKPRNFNRKELRIKTIDVAAAVLVVVGALNWGLVGMFQFDLVAALFGNASGMSRLVYSLVGLAGVFQAMQWKGIQRRWSMTPAMVRA